MAGKSTLASEDVKHMVVNLDHWLEVKNWPRKQVEEGVEVIDKCLFLSKSKMSKSPRKKTRPGKYKEFIVDIPVGYCPKCSKYINAEEDGVVCRPCQSYWHYDCVGVTQEELDVTWKDVQFLCPFHRNKEIVTTEDDEQNDQDNNGKIKIINVKVNDFALNAQKKIKE